MKKKISLSAVLLLAAFLAACGNGGAAVEEKNNDTELPSKAETVAEEKTEAPETLFDFADVAVEVPIYENVSYTNVLGTCEYSDFVFDDKGNIIQKKTSGTYNSTTTYEYDEKGNMLVSTEVHRSGKVNAYTYTYREDGLVDTCAESDKKEDGSPGLRDGNFWTYEYEFDDAGRVVKKTTDNKGYIMVYIYEYDSNNQVIREIQTDQNSTYEIIYSYDKNGNKVSGESKELETGYELFEKWEYGVVGSKTFSIAGGDIAEADSWTSFEEVSGLPVPSSCVNAISAGGTETNESAIIYTFFLTDDKKVSDDLYKVYQGILENYCGFHLQYDENQMVYVYKDDTLVSAFMAGEESEKGYFIKVSFPRQS